MSIENHRVRCALRVRCHCTSVAFSLLYLYQADAMHSAIPPGSIHVVYGVGGCIVGVVVGDCVTLVLVLRRLRCGHVMLILPCVLGMRHAIVHFTVAQSRAHCSGCHVRFPRAGFVVFVVVRFVVCSCCCCCWC